jgi:hypothetical protein
MKLIGVQNAVAALRAPIDEVGSDVGAPFREMNAKLVEAFQFVSIPIIGHTAVNTNPQPTAAMTYQQGELEVDDRRVALMSLVFTVEGIVVTCRRSEHADAALNKITELFDSSFGSRYGQTKRKRLYLSTLVVEFEGGFLEDIGPITRMERAITDAVKGDRFRPGEFRAKHLSFGQEPGLIQNVSIFETLERSDFLIERRVQHEFSENVFFSSAPTTTPDHLALLEKLEAIALGRD